MKATRTEKIRAVLLDLGNVLVFHDNARLARNLADAVGRTVSDVETWARRNNDAINRGGLDGRGIFESFKAAMATPQAKALSYERFSVLWSSHFTMHEEVAPLVESLVSNPEVKVALVSNTNALHVDYLRPRLPILDRFDALCFSNEVGRAKPDPEIYAEALRRTGSRPDEAIFFDDLREYVDAASSLGIHGYAFTTTEAFRSDLSEWGLGGTE